MTVKEISKKLKVHQETVRRWIRGYKIDAIKSVGKRGYDIKEEDLHKFLNYRKKECIGCISIHEETFPFVVNILTKYGYLQDKYLSMGFFIDSEGCIEESEGNGYLKIFYCPVCGKKLQIKKQK